ncbi:unnamed protein product [Prunus brigantina]
MLMFDYTNLVGSSWNKEVFHLLVRDLKAVEEHGEIGYWIVFLLFFDILLDH